MIRKIYLTKYGTIRGQNFSEISTEKFLKMINKIVKNGGKFEYDQATKTFDFEVDDGKYRTIMYNLSLGDEIKEQFEKGLYTPFTKELKLLLDNVNENDDRKKLYNLAKEQIFNGESISEDALPIYIEEKEKDLNFSLSDVKRYFTNLIDDIRNIGRETYHFLDMHIWPFTHFTPSEAFGGAFLSSIILYILIGAFSLIFQFSAIYLLFSLAPFVLVYAIPTIKFIYEYIKKRGGRFSNFIKRHKFGKKELESLKKENEELTFEKIEEQSKEEVLLESEKNIVKEKEPESITITKTILLEFSNLIDKIKSINNPELQQKYYQLVTKLFKEFNERVEMSEVNRQKRTMTLDGYHALKNDMIVKLKNIDIKLDEELKESMRIDEISKLSLELEEKLNELNSSNREEKGKVLRKGI